MRHMYVYFAIFIISFYINYTTVCLVMVSVYASSQREERSFASRYLEQYQSYAFHDNAINHIPEPPSSCLNLSFVKFICSSSAVVEVPEVMSAESITGAG